jgi:hypothetical protein
VAGEKKLSPKAIDTALKRSYLAKMQTYLSNLALIYCVRELSPNRYIALNRNYKPIGMATDDHLKYEADETRLFRFKRRLRLVSWERMTVAIKDGHYFFFKDSQHPRMHQNYMMHYSQRIYLLSQYRIYAADDLTPGRYDYLFHSETSRPSQI